MINVYIILMCATFLEIRVRCSLLFNLYMQCHAFILISLEDYIGSYILVGML